ncbi:MAG: hypothetical protein IJ735_06860 [Clostridia bacterium]|nr:hypothetical protein [Clostridia bacterium]
MFGFVTLVLTNNTLLLPAIVAIPFRKMILRLWKAGVRLLCSAFFGLAALACLICGSFLTMLFAAGDLGGVILGEFAAEYLHPMVYWVLIACATAFLVFFAYYLFGRSSLRGRGEALRPSPVVIRLSDAVEACRKPRFILLQ